jgi:hypothetical protein
LMGWKDVGLLFYFTKPKCQTIGDTKIFHLPFVLATCQTTRFAKCNLANYWRCSNLFPSPPPTISRKRSLCIIASASRLGIHLLHVFLLWWWRPHVIYGSALTLGTMVYVYTIIFLQSSCSVCSAIHTSDPANGVEHTTSGWTWLWYVQSSSVHPVSIAKLTAALPLCYDSKKPDLGPASPIQIIGSWGITLTLLWIYMWIFFAIYVLASTISADRHVPIWSPSVLR